MPYRTAISSILSLVALTLPATAIEGSYKNDMRTILKITKRGNVYRAAIDLVWKGCMGHVEGPATLKGSVMTVRGRDSASPDACVVKITFKGRAAILNEQSGCLPFHGAACEFTGAVKH